MACMASYRLIVRHARSTCSSYGTSKWLGRVHRYKLNRRRVQGFRLREDVTSTERLHISEGLESGVRARRTLSFAIEAKAMRFARIGQHIESFVERAQFRNQYFLVEPIHIHPSYIALQYQNRAFDSLEFRARQLSELRCVVTLWVCKDESTVGGSIALTLFRDAAVVDARQQHTGRLLGNDGANLGGRRNFQS